MNSEMIVGEAFGRLKEFDVTFNPNIKDIYESPETTKQFSICTAFNSAYGTAKDVGLIVNLPDETLGFTDLVENKTLLVDMMSTYLSALPENIKHYKCQDFYIMAKRVKSDLLIMGFENIDKIFKFRDVGAYKVFYEKYGFSGKKFDELTDVEYYCLYLKILDVVAMYCVSSMNGLK